MRTCRHQLRLCSLCIVHLTSHRLPLARCLWAPCQRCSDWSPSNGKSIPQSDLEHSWALTGSAYRWQADAIHQCHRGVGGGIGPWTPEETCYLTRTLHYAHWRPNQIKVMYGNKAMDFPSTYGSSLSLDDPTAETCSSANLGRLVEPSTRHRKGHPLWGSPQLMWHPVCECECVRARVLTHMHLT